MGVDDEEVDDEEVQEVDDEEEDEEDEEDGEDEEDEAGGRDEHDGRPTSTSSTRTTTTAAAAATGGARRLRRVVDDGRKPESEWTIDDLLPEGDGARGDASVATVHRLLDELHARWQAPSLHPDELAEWVADHFDVTADGFDYAQMDRAKDRELWRIGRLWALMKTAKVEGGAGGRQDGERVPDVLGHGALRALAGRAAQEHGRLRPARHPAARPDEGLPGGERHVAQARRVQEQRLPERLSGAVRVFVDGVVLPRRRRLLPPRRDRLRPRDVGLPQAIKIADYIKKKTSYERNLTLWRYTTASGSTFNDLVRHMTERPLYEARDLDEDMHLRLHEGDAYGHRGAGVYDHAQDAFWPYVLRHE